ncbi:MAG TPA: FAD-dependent oxidoreductase [Pseudonocardiaceae bacterium]
MTSAPERLRVAVIGAGGGGLVAALTARSHGVAASDVAVFDAADAVGGTYAYSTGLIWAPATTAAARLGLDDSPEEGMAHIRRLGAGRHDEAIARAYIDDLAAALDFLAERHDVPYEVVRNYPDYYSELDGGKAEGRYVASPVFDATTLPDGWGDRLVRSPIYAQSPTSWPEVQRWGGFGTVDRWDRELLASRLEAGVVGFGTATVGYLLRAALRAGVDIRLGRRLTGLDRAPSGWTLTFDDGSVVAAASVVLAAGAYDWSARLQGMFDPHPAPVSVGIPTVTGDVITLALEAGASFAVVSGQILVPSVHMPGETFNGQPLRRLFVREPAFPGSLVVNAAGRRFADESFYRDLVSGLTHFDAKTQSYPNLTAWVVFDRAWKDKYALGSVPPGVVPSWMTRAGSAAELAGLLGIPAAALEQTLAEYNADAASGVDTRFGRGGTAYARNNGDADVRPNPCLRPLSGELFAVPVSLATVGGSAGLRFDTSARVIDWRDRPLPGLYCAGNTGAGLVEGFWYNSGIANGRAFAFGYRAGRHLVENP